MKIYVPPKSCPQTFITLFGISPQTGTTQKPFAGWMVSMVSNCGASIQLNAAQQLNGMNSWYMHHSEDSRRCVEWRTQTPKTVPFTWHSRKDKSARMENSSKSSQNWGCGLIWAGKKGMKALWRVIEWSCILTVVVVTGLLSKLWELFTQKI